MICFGSLSAAALVVEEEYPVAGVHLLPEVQLTEAAGVRQYFHIDANFIKRFVQGIVEGTDQVVMIHEVEFVSADHNRNRSDAQVVV